MKYFALFFISIVLFSCSRTDDSSVNECTSDCTTVSGFIVRDNDMGIGGITVEFFFEKRPTFSSIKRIIARGTTKEDGSFEIRGYINEEELGIDSDGNFGVRILEENLSDNFIKDTGPIQVESGLATGISTNYEKNIPYLNSRDTVIHYNLTAPLKAPMVLKIRNFDTSVESNSIEVNTFLDIPENTSDGSITIYNGIDTAYTQQEIETFGAQNFSNQLVISKRKNGELIREIIEVFVSDNQNNEVIIDF